MCARRRLGDRVAGSWEALEIFLSVWWVLRQPLAGCPRDPGSEALPRAQLIHFLGQCLAPENVWVCEWPGAVYTGSRLLAMFVASVIFWHSQPVFSFLLFSLLRRLKFNFVYYLGTHGGDDYSEVEHQASRPVMCVCVCVCMCVPEHLRTLV